MGSQCVQQARTRCVSDQLECDERVDRGADRSWGKKFMTVAERKRRNAATRSSEHASVDHADTMVPGARHLVRILENAERVAFRWPSERACVGVVEKGKRSVVAIRHETVRRVVVARVVQHRVQRKGDIARRRVQPGVVFR